MVIEPKKVVALHYTLKETSEVGQQIESTFGSEPLAFIYGIGMMLPEFERNLSGKAVGDSFAFGLSAEDAYGEYNEEAVVDLPKSLFEHDGKIAEGLLEVGNRIPMKNDQGRQLIGVVKWVGLENVKMDFNHPMAGTDLWFEGTIEVVRDADQSELAHGHVHGPGGHHH